ncbi:MAG: hypothetical protein ACRCUP_06365 [Mycoplasmatales bacterium]
MNYKDPWSKVYSVNDYLVEELISALQKSIRKAKTEDACFFAYEMYITSRELENLLWLRLTTIAVEDIGFGNLDAIVYVNNLDEARKKFEYRSVDRSMFFIHAIRILCESTKDRSSDILKNIVIKSVAMGKLKEIPEYAYDKHTAKGRSMGRDSMHFLNVASQVIPQLEVDNNYREQYEEILKEYDRENLSPTHFDFEV